MGSTQNNPLRPVYAAQAIIIYGKAPHFTAYLPTLSYLYLGNDWKIA